MQASAPNSSRRVFLRHFAEMVLAMLLGMGVFAALAAVAFAAAERTLTDQPGALWVVLTGLSMTMPMVAWMSYRGHSRGRNTEMAAAMMVPSAIAAAGIRGGCGGVAMSTGRDTV